MQYCFPGYDIDFSGTKKKLLGYAYIDPESTIGLTQSAVFLNESLPWKVCRNWDPNLG